MFKCQVESVRHYNSIQETMVRFKVSDIGNSKKPNHKLTGTVDNIHFTIGEIDHSIKEGDLLRCDGLPYMSRPSNKKVSVVWTQDEPYSKITIHKVLKDRVPGYSPFQLDSGYWVLRKNEYISKGKRVKTK